MKQKQFALLGCGGTFDLLHSGHEAFLTFAILHAEKVLIGITSDTYVKKQKGQIAEAYVIRRNAVQQFLRKYHAFEKTEILPLDSVYIPTTWENLPIDAILATPDSEGGAKRINLKRQKEGKSELVIIPFPLSIAEDGLPISSTRIREGIIDRQGRLWVNPDWKEKTFILPEPLRKTLQKPIGEIIDAKTSTLSSQETASLIAVGDVTTTLFHNRGIVPRLSVIDLTVERKKRYATVDELGLKPINLTYSAQNTPGHISSEIFQICGEIFQRIKEGKNVLLHVIGEEDLTVLPILLYAPLGWVVCYGQPRKGTVKVVVSERIKQQARTLLSKFTIR
ncbi:MAG: pantetheine-phosphate adenylyltransferase [Candidatus Levybacteria bacterium]|nr:pantetheine-phosphate adenylyltransferase [Candidatus Levybacteria bacterium]